MTKVLLMLYVSPGLNWLFEGITIALLWSPVGDVLRRLQNLYQLCEVLNPFIEHPTPFSLPSYPDILQIV